MTVQALSPKPDRFAPVRALLGDRRLVAMLGLGFSSGIPFQLVYVTQSAWLSEAHVPLSIIGLLSEMTMAYKFKFVWAPFLDRHDPPVLGRIFGRRRGWIVATQVCIAVTLAGIAFGDPGARLWWTVLFSLALGLAGASQDIVIDGWRISAAPVQRQALMSSWAEVGWRTGNLVSGAGALYLAQGFGWSISYLVMAVAVLPGFIAACAAPRPPADSVPPPPRSFTETVIEPIRELVGRLGRLALPVLLLVAGFRMPGYIAYAMAFPLFKHLHYSDADIATVTKLFGFPVGLAGTFTATWVVRHLGLMRSLLVGTVFGSASHLALSYLAAHGDHGGNEFWLFATTVSIDEFAYAFASIILITYMSALSSSGFAAAQYALLTSLCAFPGSMLAASSGFVIERTGFPWFFATTSLIGVPVAVLAFWVWRHHGLDDPATKPV